MKDLGQKSWKWSLICRRWIFGKMERWCCRSVGQDGGALEKIEVLGVDFGVSSQEVDKEGRQQVRSSSSSSSACGATGRAGVAFPDRCTRLAARLLEALAEGLQPL